MTSYLWTKIKKFLREILEENFGQTDKQRNWETYRAYFIGPSLPGCNNLNLKNLDKPKDVKKSWFENLENLKEVPTSGSPKLKKKARGDGFNPTIRFR